MAFYNKNANKHAAYSNTNAIITAIILSSVLWHPDMRSIQSANTAEKI